MKNGLRKQDSVFLTNFPMLIYIGRRFVNPISLKIGGYVQDENEINKIETYFNNMNPPISILYSIKVYVE